MIAALVCAGDREYLTEITSVDEVKVLQSLRIQLASEYSADYPELVWRDLSTHKYTPEPWTVGVRPTVHLIHIDGTGTRCELTKIMERPMHLPFPEASNIRITL